MLDRTASSVDASALRELRREVRGFLDDQLANNIFTPCTDSWMNSWSPDFSQALAQRGWVGMALPPEYGGGGKSYLERFVVTEELLLAGAPVAAHWVSDRQAGPSLVRFGSDDLKRELLPEIAAGRCYFAIGMSEPDSGSDLASIRTRAVMEETGWRLSGTKLWTSSAHRADLMIVLARTSGRHGDRHQGLSQLIVDLRGPGVTVSPVYSMDGGHHFNEVSMEDAFVPSDRLLGREGDGWRQVSSELAFERSGPERFLSTAALVSGLLHVVQQGEVEAAPDLGRLLARLHGLHHMSFSVARALHDGREAAVPAAMVKTIGSTTEGDLVELAALLVESSNRPQKELTNVIRRAAVERTGYTLRGGTNEILRGIIAKALTK